MGGDDDTGVSPAMPVTTVNHCVLCIDPLRIDTVLTTFLRIVVMDFKENPSTLLEPYHFDRLF